MLDLLVMLVSVLAMALLGLLVVVRNRRNITFRLFGVLTLAAILWFVANYFTNHVSGYSAQLFANKLSLFVGFLLISAVWLLSLYFPRKLSEHIWQRRIAAVIVPLLLFVTLFTNGIVASTVYRPDKKITDINTGNLYYFYVLSAAIFFGFLAYNFFKSYRSRELNRIQKQQVLYAAIGLVLAFAWAVLTAVVIPSVTGNWEISKYGAVGGWFIVSFVSYAIVRHKLFDIRLIVARTVGYLFALTALATIYAAVIFLILAVTVGVGNINIAQSFFYVFLAVFLSFTFQPIKRFFDRFSNKLFYQDAYDPQTFLNEFNNVLVSSIELSKISQQSVSTIQKYMKPEYVALYINKSGEVDAKLTSSAHNNIEENVESLQAVFKETTAPIIVADELFEQNSALRSKLSDHNISLVAKITSNERHTSPLGYIIIGPKKSGSVYNQQDTRALEIITNELVIAIQNALRFEEIQQFNVTLQAKVDDATKQLRRTNEKLKQLDETKDEFISMASHQLRTPLTSMKGYVSMVLEGDAGKISANQRKLLDQAFVSSQRMVYLIADLLNVSRLRTGKFIIENKPTNLAEVVDTEISQLIETAKGRGLELTYNKPKEFPTLLLDETKMRQVIMNFADNAIYYTPSGGHIQVNLEDKGDTVEYTVVDDGLGVPKSEQHHLFTKFFRAGNARKARPDGTGLGLFMAKKVVVAQGGAIVFKSEEGKGSTFGFSFSKSALAVPGKNVGKSESKPEAAGKSEADKSATEKPAEKPADQKKPAKAAKTTK